MSGDVGCAAAGLLWCLQTGADAFSRSRDGTTVELRDYWTTIRQRWRLVVAVLAVSVGFAALLTWQATPQYSSSARLFVATSDADPSQAYQGGLFATQRVASYADIVTKSRKLADQVVEDLGGNVDPGLVKRAISAEVVPDTVNLQVTAVDSDPVRARDIAQAYAEALSDLVAQLETPEGKTAPLIRAEIVDNAQVSTSAVSPKPTRNIGLGFVLGLIVGVALAVVRELLDNSLTTSEDVAEVTPAPIIGRITSDPGAVRQPVGIALANTTSWAESFRVLRTNMQYIEVDHDQKVFVVTSSVPEEGKSTTAVNLGVTLALTNQRIALVECDLRRPLIAKRLGLDGAVGTTSVLIGKVSLREAMQTYGDTGLQVLACGPIPPNPSELLQSKAMETLLAQLRAEFDVVLFDAPPLLPVTDAAILSAQADGALVVVRHGKTTRDQLAHAIERLEAVDARALGIVINMVPARRRGGEVYSYTYQYDYASRPADRDETPLDEQQDDQRDKGGISLRG
jgi:capsular exopolysaccharide synthesis family protein